MYGDRASMLRCISVWLAVTSAGAALLGWLRPERPTPGPFTELLPQLAALALATCVVWFWWVTTWTTLAAVAGRDRAVPGCPRALQRLLFALCGLAVVGAASPALADAGEPHGAAPPVTSMVAGLPLPDRATSGPLPATPDTVDTVDTVAGARIVVRPGDTLWDLAAADLPPTATVAQITAGWHALYDANRGVIDDPDLIYPSTRLDRPTQEEK